MELKRLLKLSMMKKVAHLLETLSALSLTFAVTTDTYTPMLVSVLASMEP
jgi:hypothetical protein